jgi:predicted RNA binding protein YcfA (HicA-like mRNA interferase family)
MLKIREVIAILRAHEFELRGQEGSHRQYEGVVGGTRRLVTISQKDGEDVARKLLGYIVRQSGLPKKLFRR